MSFLPFLGLVFIVFVRLTADLQKSVVTRVAEGFLGWAAFSWISLELLSVFGLLTSIGVVATWTSVIVVTSAVAFRRRLPFFEFKIFSGFEKLETFFIATVLLVLIVTLLLAILNAPNTWDSMTYHLSRVYFWAQNQSLNSFPTHNVRQISLNPLAELLILQSYLAGAFFEGVGSDRFSGLIQWLGFLVSLTMTFGITSMLGLSRKQSLFALFLMACSPTILLEASSTQNDLLCGAFVLCAVYFLLIAYKEKNEKPSDLFLAFLALALAFGTKGTALVFLFPFFSVWFFASVASLASTSQRLALVGKVLLLLMLPLALNLGYLNRNRSAFGHPLGDPAIIQRLQNEAWGPGVFVSNLVRNAALHLQVPSGPITQAVHTTIVGFHRFINIDPNDPKTSWTAFALSKSRPHEDIAGSFFLFTLWLYGGVLVHRRKQKYFLIFNTAVATSFCLFCLMFKWQPWHIRLHVPGLLLAVVGLSGAVPWFHWKPRSQWIFVGIVTVSMLPYLLFNALKPIVAFSGQSVFVQSREETYLAARPDLRAIYGKTTQMMLESRCRDFGFIGHEDGWDYPLFQMTSIAQPRWRHVLVGNVSQKYGLDSEPAPCLIVSTDGPGQQGTLPAPYSEYVRILNIEHVSLFQQPQEATAP